MTYKIKISFLAALAFILLVGLGAGTARQSEKSKSPQWAQSAEKSFYLMPGLGQKLLSKSQWEKYQQRMKDLPPDQLSAFRLQVHSVLMQEARDRHIDIPPATAEHSGKGQPAVLFESSPEPRLIMVAARGRTHARAKVTTRASRATGLSAAAAGGSIGISGIRTKAATPDKTVTAAGIMRPNASPPRPFGVNEQVTRNAASQTTPATRSTTTNITQNFVIVGSTGSPVAIFTPPLSGTTPSTTISTVPTFVLNSQGTVFTPLSFTRSAAVNASVIQSALAANGVAISPLAALAATGLPGVAATPESQTVVALTPAADFGAPFQIVTAQGQVVTASPIVTASPNLVIVGTTVSPITSFTPPSFTRSAAVNAGIIQSALEANGAAFSPLAALAGTVQVGVAGTPEGSTAVASTPEADFGAPLVRIVTVPGQVVSNNNSVVIAPVQVGTPTTTRTETVAPSRNIVTIGTAGNSVALFTPPLF